VARDQRRPTAHDIFERVAEDGRDQIHRPLHNVAFSGLLSGATMGLSGLGVAAMAVAVGSEGPGRLVADLLYPVGFLAVILGRALLFTENTLFPVAHVLARRQHVGLLARLWATVLPANYLGALAFGVLVAFTSAVTPETAAELTSIGAEEAGRPADELFWSAVVGGWLVALMAWLASASEDTTGRLLSIYVLAYLLVVGEFTHSIAGAGEVLPAALKGLVDWGTTAVWIGMAVLGNVVGGVTIVALLNYGQVHRDGKGG
jgi:formate/nitrite transporter FocA (FNT family)